MTDTTVKPLEEMSMPELWTEAKRLGISKEGKKEELIARIKQTQEEEGEGSETSGQSQEKTAKEVEANQEVVYISRYHELKLVVEPAYLKEVGIRILTIRGKYIQFHEGVYRTSDPEQIAFLDNHPNFGNVFRRIQTVDMKGKTLEQVYKDKFKTLEERERDIAVREGALRRKEMEARGQEEGAEQTVTTGVRSTTDEPKF
ncbi:hypothetical protein A3C29_05205 [Candidatus Daviesbacteria bacterium RIFCSPHIGHO2_02_FULL_40_16]|nr:MAG: hypothetical protein UX97_C0011G0008 [Candidatus Beckwithbacteria bacterium GW2011_GWA2_47_25]OGE29539.1 MAG: hypothetical protein A3C29_05205 [Candidatus Daviesbacteria bacterium RIFCSPHIGHO2_02_FULL_40_16]